MYNDTTRRKVISLGKPFHNEDEIKTSSQRTTIEKIQKRLNEEEEIKNAKKIKQNKIKNIFNSYLHIMYFNHSLHIFYLTTVYACFYFL